MFIIVATDVLHQSFTHLQDLKEVCFLCLDEADELLTPNFKVSLCF